MPDYCEAIKAARGPAFIGFDEISLRGREMAEAASIVAAIPEVRAALADIQRGFAHRPGGAVLDGRDTGTVICPEACPKIFVTASVEAKDAIVLDTTALDAEAASRGGSHQMPRPAPQAQNQARHEAHRGSSAARPLYQKRNLSCPIRQCATIPSITRWAEGNHAPPTISSEDEQLRTGLELFGTKGDAPPPSVPPRRA